MRWSRTKGNRGQKQEKREGGREMHTYFSPSFFLNGRAWGNSH